MAFGTSVSGGRDRLAAVLKIRADTGQAKQEISELGREVESVMKGMTAEQMRLDKAARQFQATLARYGPTHDKTRQAALRLDAAEKRLTASLRTNERQARRNEHAFDGTARSLSRMTRGAIAGSGIFQALGRTMAFASAGFIGTTGFVYGAKAALNAASDLNEQITKTKEVFRGTTGQVMEFADKALGLSKREALETSSTIGALIHAMGIVGPTATKASVDLTKLGVDLASFYNTSVEDSLAAIQSALVGQVRPLRRYGAEVSAAREKTVALAMTGKTSATELTRQERVMARLAIIFKDTTVAQGDYLRTSQGLANQQRTLSGNIENIAAAIGEELIPAAEDASQSINKWLSNSENQERVQNDVNKAVKIGTGMIKGFGGAISTANTVLGPFIDALGGVEKAMALAFGIGFSLKVRKFLIGQGLMQTSAQKTAAIVAAEAATMGKALDVAARPRTVIVNGAMGKGMTGKGGILGILGGAGLMMGGEQAGGGVGGWMSAAGGGAMMGGMFGGWGALAGAVIGVGIKGVSGGDSAFKAKFKAAWDKMTVAEQADALNQMGDKAPGFLKEMGVKYKGRTGMGPRPEEGGAAAYQWEKDQAAATGGKLTPAQIRANKVKAAGNMINELEIIAERKSRTPGLSDDIGIAKRIAAQKKIIADLTHTIDARKDYEQALSEVYRLEQQQAQDEAQAAAAREAERKKREAARIAREKAAAKSYRQMLAARETRLETAVDKASTLKGLTAARSKLIAFLRAETKDKKLTDKERARYEKELQDVLSDRVSDELGLREGTLKRRLIKAKASPGKADDISAEKALVAFYAAAAKRAGQTVKEVQAWLTKKAKAQAALKALIKKDKQNESRSQAQMAMDFLSTRSDFFSQFGPNVFTGAQALSPGTGNASSTPAGSTVVVNQNFTSSPDNAFRSAKMARFAYEANFDG